MGIGSNVKSRMARADDSGTKNANPDPEKVAHDTVIAVDQALQAALNCALSTREMLRSLDEKETKMHGDCNPKSQIAAILHQITKSAERELENILRKTKAWNDECIDLYGSMQESIKKTNIARLKTTLMAKLSVQNAQASALESRLKSLKYRVKIARFLSGPSDWNGRISRTNQFLLDLCLPPDRAEETSTALQDTCESRWQKRYGPRKVALLYFVQTISAIYAYHASRIFKYGGLFWFIEELKKAFAKFWAA